MYHILDVKYRLTDAKGLREDYCLGLMLPKRGALG